MSESPPPASPLGRRPTLALLGLLYVCEGLPYGFQATALPVYLRSAGLSLSAIGFLGALALPWILKPLWAPWVDAHGSRRAWILPLQLALAAVAGAAALAPPETHLGLLLALVFLMNLVAATLDVAVDGLAVDLLAPDALGSGNAAQVVGYKVGMLGGGGLLVWASAWIGWSGLFVGMALLLVIAAAITLVVLPAEGHRLHPRPEGAGRVVHALGRALRVRGAAGVLVLAGTYKLGETLTDAMWKPYLVDAGYAPAELGRLLGTLALGLSLLGSLAGGLWTTRVGPRAALTHTALLRIGPLALIAALAFVRPQGILTDRWALEAVTMVEAFFGGALTTAMFAFMMARVDRTIGATHFTLLAGAEVLGKMPPALLSGVLADAVGYLPTFVLAALLSVLFSLALPVLAPRPTPLSRDPGGGTVPA